MGQEGSDRARETHIILHVWSSPDINGVIKSSRMRFLGHVACMVDMENAHRVWLEAQKVLDQFVRRTVY